MLNLIETEGGIRVGSLQLPKLEFHIRHLGQHLLVLIFKSAMRRSVGLNFAFKSQGWISCIADPTCSSSVEF